MSTDPIRHEVAQERFRQYALVHQLGQATCGIGNRHAEHALTDGACLRCGAAL